jgi:hypothetical protein
VKGEIGRKERGFEAESSAPGGGKESVANDSETGRTSEDEQSEGGEGILLPQPIFSEENKSYENFS